MNQQYLLAIDAGTGSIRAVLFDTSGRQIDCVQEEWEHHEDPREAWTSIGLSTGTWLRAA